MNDAEPGHKDRVPFRRAHSPVPVRAMLSPLQRTAQPAWNRRPNILGRAADMGLEGNFSAFLRASRAG